MWSVARSRNAQAQIAAAARNTPKAGSVTQSSNNDSGVTTDSVSVEVTRGTDGTVTYEVQEAGGWSVSRSKARVLERGTDQEGGNWAEFHQAPDGSPGTGTGPGLYVDVYTDIEAPTTETVRTGGGDGARNVPIGTQLSSGNLNIIVGGGTSQRGTLDGAAGTFTCPSNCRISNGNVAEGSWTFTPDRPPGALDVPGNAAGVVFTGNFDTTRTDGTFNGAAGYFKCLSRLTTGCGRRISNGRLSMLSGDWIFVSTAAGTTTRTVQDTDYLAGGVWVRVPADATSVADYEFGAFVDGNDPFEQSNLAGLTGTATYSGEASAVYSVVSTGQNYFPDAEASLTANFGDGAALGTIEGRIHDITGDGPASDSYDGVVINLGSAAIGGANSGFFTGDVTTAGTDSPFTGKWGGQFYGNGAAATDPPGSVVGTFGAATANGGESFVGLFGADRE